MELIQVLQKVAVDVVNAMNLTDVCYGTVENTQPLEIRLDSRLLISEKLIRLTAAVTEQKHTHGFSGSGTVSQTMTVPPLDVGDRVLMLKAMRGTIYIVLDKVVD